MKITTYSLLIATCFSFASTNLNANTKWQETVSDDPLYGNSRTAVFTASENEKQAFGLMCLSMDDYQLLFMAYGPGDDQDVSEPINDMVFKFDDNVVRREEARLIIKGVHVVHLGGSFTEQGTVGEFTFTDPDKKKILSEILNGEKAYVALESEQGHPTARFLLNGIKNVASATLEKCAVQLGVLSSIE